MRSIDALADGYFHDFDPEDACVGALGECADVDGSPPCRCAPSASDSKSAQESPSPSALPNPDGCRGDDADGLRGDDIAIPRRARRSSGRGRMSRDFA
jgi:hypothetical protein